MGFEALKQEWTEHVMTLASERFERRLAEELAGLRIEFGKELHGGLADVRREMSNMRVELLRWSYLFWLGQITVIAAMLSYMLRVLSP
jgi:hypothetical protein